jgi:glycosyltransferase involved in cell wall biosynthesis
MTRSAAPFITVAVCTRNRPAELEKLLESATRLVLPQGLSWELLIVDNGSTDGVEQLCERFRARLPLRLVAEPQPGLSNARNRAVAAARGSYICWTDDDVLLSPEWLSAYGEAFRRHPEAAVFGGRIVALLDEPSPSWVRASLDRTPLPSAFAHLEIHEAGPISDPRQQSPWGANFAIRTAEQRQLAYDPQLGRSPHHARLGEECDLIVRLFDRGVTGFWVPNAIVHHCIPLDRQTRRRAWAYFTSVGQTAEFNAPDAARRWSRTGLMARVGAYGALFGLASAVGRHRHATTFLARTGIYAGMLRSRREAVR